MYYYFPGESTMRSSSSSSSSWTLFIFPLLILSVSSLPFGALALPPRFSFSTDACHSSLFPKLCLSLLRSFLAASPSQTDFFMFGKHSVEQSLKQARETSTVIKHYLSPKSSRSPGREVLASLHDCLDLTASSAHNLESILTEFERGDLARLGTEVARVRTRLSAVLANEQTCFDGLKEANNSIVEPLSKLLSRAIRMYRVSFRLVTRALSQNNHTSHGTRNRVLMQELLPSRARMPLNYLIENIRHGNCNPLKNCPRREHASSYIDDRGILINNIVTVGHTHRDDFNSISKAIESSPRHSWAEDGYYVIYVRSGVYKEYVRIPYDRKHVLLLGDGIGKTIITGNRSHHDGWTTYHSATFAVAGEGFIAVDITFRNTAGLSKGQAVAVRNAADLSTFYRCSFEGYQDTLLNHAGRQFFRECDIYGTVDFIFGFATAFFQNCNIYTRKPRLGEQTVVTAQGRSDPEDSSGFFFQNCTIRPATDLAKDRGFAVNYLGRPWYDHSRTVFMQSYIDKHIHPKGWLPFRSTDRLDKLYYGEYNNRGPGSSTRGRVHWKGYHVLDIEQALSFTLYNITGSAWLPQIDIPHTGGLL